MAGGLYVCAICQNRKLNLCGYRDADFLPFPSCAFLRFSISPEGRMRNTKALKMRSFLRAFSFEESLVIEAEREVIDGRGKPLEVEPPRDIDAERQSEKCESSSESSPHEKILCYS